MVRLIGTGGRAPLPPGFRLQQTASSEVLARQKEALQLEAAGLKALTEPKCSPPQIAPPKDVTLSGQPAPIQGSGKISADLLQSLRNADLDAVRAAPSDTPASKPST